MASKVDETIVLKAVVDELTGVLFSFFYGQEVGGMETTIKVVAVCSNEVLRYIRWCKGVPAVSSWLQA